MSIRVSVAVVPTIELAASDEVGPPMALNPNDRLAAITIGSGEQHPEEHEHHGHYQQNHGVNQRHGPNLSVVVVVRTASGLQIPKAILLPSLPPRTESSRGCVGPDDIGVSSDWTIASCMQFPLMTTIVWLAEFWMNQE